MIPREILQEELITQLTISNKQIKEIIAYLDVQIINKNNLIKEIAGSNPTNDYNIIDITVQEKQALEQIKKWILEKFGVGKK